MANELEEKLGSILSDPNMMQQIQSMARMLGQSQPPQPESQPQKESGMDPGILQKLSGLAGQSGIDQNQQALLSALNPYLSQSKVSKLENAMRAAKLARLASGFLGSGGLQALMGR